MTQPCKNCQDRRHVFTDGEDFWRYDHDSELFRMVDYDGVFYPIHTHPGATEQQLAIAMGPLLKLATEADIIWRTVRLILLGLTQGDWNSVRSMFTK